MLFSEAAAAYLEEKRRTRRANTVEGYESALRCHVLPRWGAMEVAAINTDDVQEWVLAFDKPGAAQKAFKTLRQVLRWTIRKHHLRIWLATEGVELPRKPAYRPRVLDARGLKNMLRALWGSDPEVEGAAIIGGCLGARRGEAAAVDLAKDIDWRTGEVHLGASLQVVGGEVVVMPPKTPKSDRVAVLPAFALRRLRQIFPKSKRKGRIAGEARPDAVARRIRAVCKAAGVDSVPPTMLRHTWATLAIEAGVGIETVAMMLGHTGIGTAYKHYIMSRTSICREAQRAVEKLLLAA